LIRVVFFLFLSISFLFSASKNVEITATKFESYENKLFSKFEGNVVVTKGKDSIKADKLYVYFDKKKNPNRYEAIGNVNFTVYSNTNHYNGKSNKLIYYPNKKEFHLMEKAYVEDGKSDKKVYGDKILFNEKSGDIKVLSSSKNAPVKFIFKVNE
jgi:lipopolysaccharide export system protein LptA